jgi:hypothetical protein
VNPLRYDRFISKPTYGLREDDRPEHAALVRVVVEDGQTDDDGHEQFDEGIELRECEPAATMRERTTTGTTPRTR